MGGHYWQSDYQDALEVPPDLRYSVEWFASQAPEHERAFKYFLDLRDMYGRALDTARSMFDVSVAAHVRDPGGRLQRVEDLVRMDRALERALHQAGQREEPLVALRHVQKATRRLADLLGPDVPAEVRPSWRWEAGRRGPDRGPRKVAVNPTKPKPPPPTREQKQARSDAKRVARIVALLRKHPNGLSENGIFKAMTIGRAELKRALKAESIEQRGTLANPRYCVTGGLSENGPAKK